MTTRAQVTVTWRGPAAKATAHRALAAGLLDGAQLIADASAKVVPKDTEALDRSRAVSVDEAALVAAVSYDTDYAVRRHERLGDRHPHGGTSKYLERPAIANRRRVGSAIASRMRRELGGLG